MSYLVANPKDRFSRDEAHTYQFVTRRDGDLKNIKCTF